MARSWRTWTRVNDRGVARRGWVMDLASLTGFLGRASWRAARPHIPDKDRAGHLRDRGAIVDGDLLQEPVHGSDAQFAHTAMTQSGDDLGQDPVAVAGDGGGGLGIK